MYRHSDRRVRSRYTIAIQPFGIACLFFLADPAVAQTIMFNDPDLRDAVRAGVIAAGRPDPGLDIDVTEVVFPSDPKFTFLSAGNSNISDLTGLEACTDLEAVVLFNNGISDLSPVANLVNLQFLDVSQNNISDLGPLAGLLDHLESLVLDNNNISDVSPLDPGFSLGGFELLRLNDNQIVDIGPLRRHLDFGNTIRLRNNQIEDLSVFFDMLHDGVSWSDLSILDLGGNNIESLGALAPHISIDDNSVFPVLPPLAALTIDDLPLNRYALCVDMVRIEGTGVVLQAPVPVCDALDPYEASEPTLVSAGQLIPDLGLDNSGGNVDIDTFTFVLDDPAFVTVQAMSILCQGTPSIEVSDPGGVVLSADPEDCETTIASGVLPEGNYTITAFDEAENFIGYYGLYLGVDYDEAENRVYAINEAVVARMLVPELSDIDDFVYAISGTQLIHLSMSSPAGTPSFEVLDGQDNSVLPSADLETEGEYLYNVPDAGGSGFFRVRVDGVTTTGDEDYLPRHPSLTVHVASQDLPDKYEPDDDFSRANTFLPSKAKGLALPTYQLHNFHSATDEDWYTHSYFGPEATNPQYLIHNRGPNSDVRYDVFDLNMNFLRGGEGPEMLLRDPNLPQEETFPGKVYVRVTNSTGQFGVGTNYEITILDEPTSDGSPRATFEGFVENSQGVRLANVTVRALNPEVTTILEGITNFAGYYNIPCVPYGTYTLTATLGTSSASRPDITPLEPMRYREDLVLSPGSPAISILPVPLDEDLGVATIGGAPKTRSVTLKNVSGVPQSGSIAIVPQVPFGVSHSSYNLAANAELNILVSFSPATVGSYSATLDVEDGPTTPPVLRGIGSDRSHVWVDFSWPPANKQEGIFTAPFRTLSQGTSTVKVGGTLHIQAGSTTARPTVNKPMQIVASGGTVRIGAN